MVDDRIAELVREARVPAAAAQPPVDEDGGLVQLAVRLPARLRAELRDVAAAEGTSMQAWVTRELACAVERRRDAGADFAARLTAQIQELLAAAVTDGTYDALVAELDDPDVATI